jgi:hypothetical protein
MPRAPARTVARGFRRPIWQAMVRSHKRSKHSALIRDDAGNEFAKHRPLNLREYSLLSDKIPRS